MKTTNHHPIIPTDLRYELSRELTMVEQREEEILQDAKDFVREERV